MSRIMIFRVTCVINNEANKSKTDVEHAKITLTKPATREKSIDYYDLREEEDPFPDYSNLDPLYHDQEE